MKTVKRRVIPAETIGRKIQEVIVITCDVCGTAEDKMMKCSICSRDLCVGNLSKRGCSVYDPDDYGDYPEVYCPNCAELYIESRRELDREYEKKGENLRLSIKAKVQAELSKLKEGK